MKQPPHKLHGIITKTIWKSYYKRRDLVQILVKFLVIFVANLHTSCLWSIY